MGYRDAPIAPAKATAPIVVVRRAPSVIRCAVGGFFTGCSLLFFFGMGRPELALVFVCAVPGLAFSASAFASARNAAVEARLQGDSLGDDATLRWVRRLGATQAIVASLCSILSLAAYLLS
jgi:hypothetical protein